MKVTDEQLTTTVMRICNTETLEGQKQELNSFIQSLFNVPAEKKEDNSIVIKEPIHDYFELTYASYLVLPRSVLQSAPVEWQEKFVEMLEELGVYFPQVPHRGVYKVYLVDKKGKFIHDPYQDYERGRRVVTLQECQELAKEGKAIERQSE